MASNIFGALAQAIPGIQGQALQGQNEGNQVAWQRGQSEKRLSIEDQARRDALQQSMAEFNARLEEAKGQHAMAGEQFQQTLSQRAADALENRKSREQTSRDMADLRTTLFDQGAENQRSNLQLAASLRPPPHIDPLSPEGIKAQQQVNAGKAEVRPASADDKKFARVAPGVVAASQQLKTLGPPSQIEMQAIHNLFADPKGSLDQVKNLIVNPSIPLKTRQRLGALYEVAAGFNKTTGKDNPTEHFARMRAYALDPSGTTLEADAAPIADEWGRSPLNPANRGAAGGMGGGAGAPAPDLFKKFGLTPRSP